MSKIISKPGDTENLIHWIDIMLQTVNGNTFGLTETDRLEAIELAAKGLKISFDEFQKIGVDK